MSETHVARRDPLNEILFGVRSTKCVVEIRVGAPHIRTLNLSLWTHQWRLQTHLRISTCSYISGYWGVLQQFLDEGREFVIRSCMMLVSCYRECMWMMFNWSSKVVIFYLFLFLCWIDDTYFFLQPHSKTYVGFHNTYIRVAVRVSAWKPPMSVSVCSKCFIEVWARSCKLFR